MVDQSTFRMQVWGYIKFKHLDLDHKDKVALVQRRRAQCATYVRRDPDFPDKLQELWVWHRKSLGEREMSFISSQKMRSAVNLDCTTEEALLHLRDRWCRIHAQIERKHYKAYACHEPERADE